MKMLRYGRDNCFTVTVALMALLSGCSSDSTSPPTPAAVSAVDGGDLVATVETPVGPLQLRVVDGTGAPLSGISVAWSVASGGGSVSPASSTTDASGVAETTWTLGPTAGAQSVTGTVNGLPAVTFTATAEPGPASQVVVTPGTITLDALGATGQFSATLADANGNAITGGTFDWSSSAVGVASIDATGAAEAVSNGTSTITASSGGFAGTGVVTVQQAAAAVAVASPSANVEIGKTVQLTATAADANGNPITNPTLAWASSAPAVATVDASGLVTGVAEGAVTITATVESASGTADLTVILVLPPFDPAANMDATGTVDASEVMIPAGVTITATGPLTINASGNVQIDGAIMGDCVAVTINGAADVVVTGVVNNGCTGLVGAETPGLTIVGGGPMTFDGTALTSTGDIDLGNDLAALSPALARSARANATAGAAPQPCIVRAFGAGITENDGLSGNDGITTGIAGRRGSSIRMMCTGDVSLLGARFEAGDGGTGGDADNPNGGATGGAGGDGGVITISTSAGSLTLENNNFLVSGQGRKGGDATSSGDPANAVAGHGGRGGPIRVVSSSTSGVTGSGTIDFFRGSGGDGGIARATGTRGADATASEAAKKAGGVQATGGDGGIVSNLFSFGFGGRSVTANDPSAGNGGDALGLGDAGGDGSMDFPPGGMGPDMSVQGGKGGFVAFAQIPGNHDTGVNGTGGLARFLGGSGGMGWNACEKGFLNRKGGPGGPGGTLTGGGAGVGETGAAPPALPGATLVESTGNGGVAGDGVEPPAAGGPQGTNSLTPADGTTAQITESFQKGDDGRLCTFNFNVGIAVKAGGDPNGHEEFIQLGTVTMITGQLLPGSQIEFTSGSTRWIKTTGTVAAGGSFNTSGTGVAAGISGVPVTFEGTLVLDGDGKITQINGMLVYDSTNSVLPAQQPPPDGDGQRHPANYNLTGTLKPPA